ncbi:molybdopterin cofactor-binding domain-containing protein, partial [Acinetobacter baumannii]
TLTGHEAVPGAMRAGPFDGDEVVVRKGDPGPVLAAAKVLTGMFYWPMQTHGSRGPSCAVADVTSEKATIWSASQSTHRFRDTCAHILGLPVQA